MGYSIVIVDHHEWEEDPIPSGVIVVNNQMSPAYANKAGSGATVTWQLMRAMNELFDLGDNMNDYLDIVALGAIGDMMDCTTPENRFIFSYGLKNLKSEFLKTFIRKQCYPIFGIAAKDWNDGYYTNDKLTQTAISFYIVPFINALIRVGNESEKELMFMAMSDIPSGKTHKEDRTDAEQSYRDCSNAKVHQDKFKNEAVEQLSIQIQNNCLEDNKILILNGDELDVPKTITGLCAMGVAAKYKKPCLLGRTNDGYIKGSFRGREDSELKDLKKFLKESGFIDYALGRRLGGPKYLFH